MRLSVDYRKHFTMIRAFHLADFFTLANAACGVAAIFCAMTYVDRQSLTHFFTATALVPAALIFDMLDGRVARWRQLIPRLGANSIHSPTSYRSGSGRQQLDSPPGCAEVGTG